MYRQCPAYFIRVRGMVGRLAPEHLAEIDLDPSSMQLPCELRVPIPTQRLVQHTRDIRWALDGFLVESDNSSPTKHAIEEARLQHNVLTGTRIQCGCSLRAAHIVCR